MNASPAGRPRRLLAIVTIALALIALASVLRIADPIDVVALSREQAARFDVDLDGMYLSQASHSTGLFGRSVDVTWADRDGGTTRFVLSQSVPLTGWSLVALERR